MIIVENCSYSEMRQLNSLSWMYLHAVEKYAYCRQINSSPENETSVLIQHWWTRHQRVEWRQRSVIIILLYFLVQWFCYCNQDWSLTFHKLNQRMIFSEVMIPFMIIVVQRIVSTRRWPTIYTLGNSNYLIQNNCSNYEANTKYHSVLSTNMYSHSLTVSGCSLTNSFLSL